MSHAQTMSWMCWFEKLSRWNSKSLFAVFSLYCKRLNPEWSLKDTFLWWDVWYSHCHDLDESQRSLVWFQLSHSQLCLATCVLMIPFKFDLRNHHAQSLHIVERPNFQNLSQGMQPMKWLRQLKGHAPAAACKRLRLRKSLPHCQGTQWLKKQCICPLFSVMAARIIECWLWIWFLPRHVLGTVGS